MAKSQKQSIPQKQLNPLDRIEEPEIVFGLVAPVGTPLENVTQVLVDELGAYGYKSETVRVSDFIGELIRDRSLSKSPEYERYIDHIRAGTELRERFGRGDVLACLDVREINRIREKNIDGKVAYIVRSFKHTSEIELFRNIYGKRFVLLSVYAPKSERVTNLRDLFQSSAGSADSDSFRKKAEEVVNIDQKEEGTVLGQEVTKAFPKADIFLDVSAGKDFKGEINRFLMLLFGYPFETPTQDEIGMFLAFSYALRSADLSRQVGAVISASDLNIVSFGCNEVPKSGGGQYWPGNGDFRDFQKGFDSSTIFKDQIIGDVIEKLYNIGMLNQRFPDISAVRKHVKETEGILSDTIVSNLLEFGRPVHAEMAALTDAARRGLSVQGATLYCTTFPCHMCARHIVSSGVSKVVYVEPYPKSMAGHLYEDSIEIDVSVAGSSKVFFTSFVGVSPKKFQELFSMPIRKKSDGKKIEWSKRSAHFKFVFYDENYIMLEERVCKFIEDTLMPIQEQFQLEHVGSS